MSGKFKKALGTGEMTIANGQFTDLPVDVYNTLYLDGTVNPAMK
jgi:hypothetical protein